MAWPGSPIKIAPGSGESYPLAAARVIPSLDAGECDRLRELVGGVMDYERAEAAK